MGFCKLTADLCGKPVLHYSLQAFQSASSIDEIVLVTGLDYDVSEFSKVSAIVKGGKTRFESMRNGLDAVTAKSGVVLIHDGARPLITSAGVNRIADVIVDTVNDKCIGAIYAVPVKETLKSVADGCVTATADRSVLYLAQTPQAFDLDELRYCTANVWTNNYATVTDESMLFEKLGKEVRLKIGSYSNVKITTPEDLIIAKALMNSK